MPRKKQNVDAYGKSWSPIDIPNLEKAIKLYERLNYLQDHFADSLSGSHNIMSQINEKTDIQNELQELGIKLTEDQAKKVIESLKLRQRENELLDKSNRSTSGVLVGNLNSNPYEKTTSYNKPNVDIYKQDSIRGYLNNAGSIYSTSKQNRLYNQAVNIEAEKLKAAGSIMSNEGLRKTAEINIKNGKMSNEASKLLDKSAQGFTKGASVIQIAADTLLAGVNKLASLFFEGANKQKQVYEDTFTNISVRNRTTRSQYYAAQSELNNELEDQNLFNNIGSSEIMQMWNTLASQGISVDMSSEEDRAELTAKAIDTVLTNKIVPYLDTSDAYFQQLTSFQPQLMKQVRGIGLLNQELVGSNVIANKYLQDMIVSLSPVSRFSSQQLGIQYAKSTGAYEELRRQGISDYAIGQTFGSQESMQKEPLQALNSGNLDQVLAVVEMITNPEMDMRDTADWTKATLKGADFTSQMLGEAGKGRTGILYQGVTQTAIDTSTKAEFAEVNPDMNKVFEIMDSIDEDSLNDVSNKAAKDFYSDLNQTNQKLQELTMENVSNEFAILQQFMGHWYDVIVTAIKGVAGAVALSLGSSVIGKGIGLLGGSAAGGSGMGLIGTLGAGAAVVGLTTAAIYGIGKATRGEFDTMTEKTANNLIEEWSSSEDTNVSKWRTNKGMALAIAATDTSQQQGGIKEAFSNVYGGFRTWGANWFNSDYIERNKEFWGWLNSSGTFSEDETSGTIQRIAAYYLWDKANSLDSIEGVSKTDLEQIAVEGWNLKAIQQAADNLVAAGWAPSNKEKEKVDSKIDFAAYGAPEGSYRIGLNKVPYDNYPALLHENETVLTASTADELRNLIATYRETSQQSISFDTIIQTQTTTLCAKLDQVIESINNTNSSNIKPSWDTNSTLNNMKNLRNLNSFNN